MNRFLILLFSVLFIGCCKKPKLLDNGLTKSATKITEYEIKVDYDILNNEIRDTLSIIENKYNDNDQIISRKERSLLIGDTMKIEYLYNENKKVIKEIGKLSMDSSGFIVDYIYKDSLLLKTVSGFVNEIYRFNQIVEYEYDAIHSLKQSSLWQHYVNMETRDTITNTLEITKYASKELVTETRLTDYINPEKNKIIKYKYECGRLTETREFNTKDSLISKMEYKYVLDKFDNWTKLEFIENSILKSIKIREIEYK